VDDAINAGSAVCSAVVDVLACGGDLVGIGCLVEVGDTASAIAIECGVPLFRLTSIARGLWSASECPLCRAGVPLSVPPGRR